LQTSVFKTNVKLSFQKVAKSQPPASKPPRQKKTRNGAIVGRKKAEMGEKQTLLGRKPGCSDSKRGAFQIGHSRPLALDVALQFWERSTAFKRDAADCFVLKAILSRIVHRLKWRRWAGRRYKQCNASLIPNMAEPEGCTKRKSL
jgi:hypothetical protein